MFYILFTFILCKPCNLANSSAIHCKQRDTEEKGACKVLKPKSLSIKARKFIL